MKSFMEKGFNAFLSGLLLKDGEIRPVVYVGRQGSQVSVVFDSDRNLCSGKAFSLYRTGVRKASEAKGPERDPATTLQFSGERDVDIA